MEFERQQPASGPSPVGDREAMNTEYSPHQDDPEPAAESRRLLKRRLELNLRGELDAEQLDQLRGNLTLTTPGVSKDPANIVLGQRIEYHRRYSRVVAMDMRLLRTGTEEWTLTIDALPNSDIEPWRCLAEISTRTARLKIVAIREPVHDAAPEQAEQNEASQNSDRPKLRVRGSLGAEPVKDIPGTTAIADFTDFEIRLPIPPRRPAEPGWFTLTDTEVVHLAKVMCALVWTWRMNDILGLGAVFGWGITDLEPGLVTLDTALGTADSFVHGLGTAAYSLDVALTTYADDTDAGRDALYEAYGRMARALIDVLGLPVQIDPEEDTEMCWAAPLGTLSLLCSAGTVRLVLREAGQPL
ncbi:DUF6301 family protein [Nocardia sp. NPDC006630]|uniref:DUF6301 family protein n=1 Tax=Nocardia sp. NPDC006630 TaxID=3157181 RepID=UPI0033B78A8C